MSMPRLSHTLRASSALALVAAGLGLGLSAADASTVPGAVTDVRIEERAAATWSQLKLHLDWRVPDGTSSGDTFVLTLPQELRATDGTRFRLRDKAGATVAEASVTGRRVTFTMTDYARSHTGVHGSAWFWVEFADGVAPGDSLDLRFDVDSVVFRDQVRIERPGPGNPSYPVKWQRWTSPERDRFLWAVDGPVVQPNMVGSSYEITDNPGPGQRLDCDRIDVFTGTRDDTWTQTGYIVKSRLTDFSCTPAKVRIVVTPTADQVGQSFRLLGMSIVTDPTLTEYRNDGFVRLWNSVTLPVTHAIRAGGGGEGTGLLRPAVTATATPTSVPTSATPTPTATVPVIVPGQPAPTTSGIPMSSTTHTLAPPRRPRTPPPRRPRWRRRHPGRLGPRPEPLRSASTPGCRNREWTCASPARAERSPSRVEPSSSPSHGAVRAPTGPDPA
ncbi:Ig-like domain-containing protein [Mobilicoccus massiliensis]|uniref:Ig-like domain-containing protein n=2 Tax=Mobilicoccus massiliensis TaxID=1522310 RepID=UPI00058D9290|nr:Ig-like domain-containing protein [Mobilicoccus massiliensis]